MHPMNPVAIILMVCGAVALVLNIFAGYRVIRSEQLEPVQKIAQCVLIWLIPVLGAGLCITLTREPKPTREKGYPTSGTTMDPLAVDAISLDHGGGDYFIE